MSGSGTPARNYRPKNPQIRYQGIFAKIDFPDYQFREYPKHISLADGGYAIATSLKHELEIRAELADKIKAPSSDARHPIEAERDDLEQKLSDAQRDNHTLQEQLALQRSEHKAAMEQMSEQMAEMVKAQNVMMAAIKLGPETPPTTEAPKLSLVLKPNAPAIQQD